MIVNFSQYGEEFNENLIKCDESCNLFFNSKEKCSCREDYLYLNKTCRNKNRLN